MKSRSFGTGAVLGLRHHHTRCLAIACPPDMPGCRTFPRTAAIPSPLSRQALVQGWAVAEAQVAAVVTQRAAVTVARMREKTIGTAAAAVQRWAAVAEGSIALVAAGIGSNLRWTESILAAPGVNQWRMPYLAIGHPPGMLGYRRCRHIAATC